VTDKTQTRAGIGFVVFTILALASIFLLRWQPRADFDVTGVLWLMQNILPLIIFSVFFALAAGAGIVWLRCRRRARRQPRELA
jgi:heme/copper-type cytochrome/quinol oxidase subunit 2